VLCGISLYSRPLLPVDETRYMSVAWEMMVHHGWLKPLTLNFEPYHHKPPLLFWLINLSWSIFGVSRWAGLIPPVLSSLASLYLIGILGRLLSPMQTGQDRNRVGMLMAATVPFMLYGTLVMFDSTLCAIVLASLVLVVQFARQRRLRDAVLIGFLLGIGVLCKGPVAYLHVLPVLLLAPIWQPELSRRGAYYASCLTMVLISAIPVLLWLVPVLQAAGCSTAESKMTCFSMAMPSARRKRSTPTQVRHLALQGHCNPTAFSDW
jgi:4-amino-4-deoxy-L-arabinose transferase-like glycosyltransferase